MQYSMSHCRTNFMSATHRQLVLQNNISVFGTSKLLKCMKAGGFKIEGNFLVFSTRDPEVICNKMPQNQFKGLQW